jgi:hypothetical protein
VLMTINNQHHRRANHPRCLSSRHNAGQGFCNDNGCALAPVLDVLAATPTGYQIPPRPPPRASEEEGVVVIL